MLVWVKEKVVFLQAEKQILKNKKSVYVREKDIFTKDEILKKKNFF